MTEPHRLPHCPMRFGYTFKVKAAKKKSQNENPAFVLETSLQNTKTLDYTVCK